ncbi:radical SAM protein [Halomonas xianhensis]|uniref:Radical SAM superfamily protein n=1 Tax=Modicisalibacter xianhensis TaxID=442341 RepID=A0A1I3G2M7_9GAMM|nr:Radical SAM superfamily protein [Halomonas xianhensis]
MSPREHAVETRLRFLAFRFYDGCPVACAHCSIEAPTKKPHRNSVTPRDVIALCRLGKTLGTKPLVFMTGSELCLGDPDLADLAAEIVLGEGMVLAVLTSGYWARTEQGRQDGLHYLRRCGISHVQLSVDSFHHRALDPASAQQLVACLTKEGLSVIVNETVNPGQPSIAPAVVEQAGVSSSIVHTFTRNAVGAAARLQAAHSPLSAPYHECDYGAALYLQADGFLYHCSGPASMCQGRAVGRIENGQVSYYPRTVAALRTEILPLLDETRHSDGDECSACLRHFKGRTPSWLKAEQIITTCS